MRSYVGNKNFSNVIHFLVNHLPLSSRYFSLFFGSGGLENSIYTASSKWICSEIDPNCKKYEKPPQSMIEFSDYKDLIESFVFTRSDLIFADPPYILSSRSSDKKYYKFEFTTRDHIEFLNYMISINSNIMITHPECGLYSSFLHEWFSFPFSYMTRGGIFKDCLYSNFSIGSRVQLLSYDCLGHNFIDRQRIKRQRSNIVNKFKRLNPQIRFALLKALKKENLL